MTSSKNLTNARTRIEQVLHRVMRNAGLRNLRCEGTDLPGTPDVVCDEARVAGFGHGCFWHAHEGCRCSRMPTTNTEFWQRKFERNRQRDRRAVEALRHQGWTVLTVWECASLLADEHELQGCVDLALRAGLRRPEIRARSDGSGKCAILWG